MQKWLLFLVGNILAVFFLISTAQAQAYAVGSPQWCALSEANRQLCATTGSQGANMGQATDPRVTVVLIIKVLLTFGATILFILDVYAGFLWMTAGGNEEQVAKAKNTLRNSTIGLIIVVFAYTITTAALNIAEGQPLSPQSYGTGPL